MVLALAGFTSVAMAQSTVEYENIDERYQVLTNKFWDNWFIQIGGGGEMTLGNKDVNAPFKDRISPTFNLALGKWFTPGLGLRLQYSGFQSRGWAISPNDAYVDGRQRNADGYYEQKFKYMNLHGDILFNLSEMLGGHKETRVYSFIPYLGAGFYYNYDSPKTKGFTINGGLINKFRLSSAWDLNIEMSIMGAPNKFDGELGGKVDADAVLAASIGFTYKFPKRGFDRPVPSRQLISEAELRNLRNRMNEMSAENQNLRNELANAQRPVNVVQPEIVDANMAPRSVFFKIGSHVINDAELINLEFVADQMKEYTSQRYTVTGYADSATGSAQLNQRLSEQRAQAVVDALVNKYGISRDRFTTVTGMGGVAKYSKPYLNRMALIEMVK